MAKTHAPPSSFSDKLQTVLRRGATEPLEIEFATPKLALRFKQRLNALRNSLMKANHPDWPELYRAGVYTSKDKPNTVVVKPRDSEFDEALSKIGVAAGEVKVAERTPTDSNSSPSDDPADDFLNSLKE